MQAHRPESFCRQLILWSMAVFSTWIFLTVNKSKMSKDDNGDQVQAATLSAGILSYPVPASIVLLDQSLAF